jgi:hypothetical protein
MRSSSWVGLIVVVVGLCGSCSISTRVRGAVSSVGPVFFDCGLDEPAVCAFSSSWVDDFDPDQGSDEAEGEQGSDADQECREAEGHLCFDPGAVGVVVA